MNTLHPARTLLIAALLVVPGMAAQPATGAEAPAAGQPVFEAQALKAPQSRIEADAAIDASVAGALVGAIVTSFEEHDVQVRLDDVRLQPVDLEQSEASGQGQVKLGAGQGEWIPFTFTALYDVEHSTASMPRLQIGRSHVLDEGTPLEQDSAIGRQLQRDLAARLEAEFPQQRPGLVLGELRMRQASTDHASLQAVGTVDFGTEGSAMATVDALYDTRAQRLVRVDYSL
ncbi:MAG: hypothetical protein Q4F49_09530 [Pseudoxanthomonas suwonensis]|nr:hypothetical protein [Pseudoxanthomonas suwonensis]